MRKQTQSNQQKIEAGLAVLETDPKNESGAHDISKLKGRDGFRLRVGRFRVLYIVQDEAVVVLVLDVGPRGDVYK